MKITILTLFPEMFESYLNNSIIKRAQTKNLVEFEIINIRDFTLHKNHRVDDYPTGGGAGLIMQCQPVLDALKSVKTPNSKTLLTSPRGATFSQKKAYELSKEDLFTILLSHRANLYPDIKDTGVDLILSGHFHGGIIRLPFLGGIIGNDEEGDLLPKYEYGMIKEGDSATMIVSGGCDKNPKKRRFFNPPEVLLITLKGE